MIPVLPQPEPPYFDAEVRSKGQVHLGKRIALNKPLSLQPYWRICLTDLHSAYSGVCAYLSIYFERVTGGASVDHFIAKSADVAKAYEWDNYRLACTVMNSRKGIYDNLLDPFAVQPDWFYLELVTGHVFANPELDAQTKADVCHTITTLKLDDAQCREVRARHFGDYLEASYTADYLKRISPFVWYEANRQGLL